MSPGLKRWLVVGCVAAVIAAAAFVLWCLRPDVFARREYVKGPLVMKAAYGSNRADSDGRYFLYVKVSKTEAAVIEVDELTQMHMSFSQVVSGWSTKRVKLDMSLMTGGGERELEEPHE